MTTAAQIPNGRISVRVNSTQAQHITRKANAHFGGNVTDYMKDLIRRDMDSDLITQGRAEALSEEITLPEEWKDRIDQQIVELQRTLNDVLGIKEQVEKVIKDQNNHRI
jgi:hypothetical protein